MKFWRSYYRARDITGGILWAIFAHSRWPSPRAKR